jgi:hypothetical protein
MDCPHAHITPEAHRIHTQCTAHYTLIHIMDCPHSTAVL